jgi:hypothetical protein
VGDEVGKQLRSFCVAEKRIELSWKGLRERIPPVLLPLGNQDQLHV